jgi:hypothetical protein
MRFLLPDPLGNDKHCRMFHSSGFAIAAGVVAVGAAAGSAAISMSAADRAKKAQGAAAAAFKKQQGEAVGKYEKGQKKVRKMISAVEAPQYNLGSMIGDASQITDYNLQQGRKISEYNRQQLEEFLPGATSQRQRQMQLINQAMGVLEEGLKGGYGQDLKENIMRDVAQFAGAGFNPATAGRAGGFQAAQGLAARQLGGTARDVQMQSLTAMPIVSNIAATWNNFAKAFTADVRAAEPLDVGRLQLGYQGAAAEVGLQKAKMTSDMFSNIYNAQSGLATQIYGANKENIASSYAAQQAVGQGVSDIGKSITDFYSGYTDAAGKLAAAKGGGGGYAGGFNYEQVYGPATYGGARPGFGNFDYGSGTGA